MGLVLSRVYDNLFTKDTRVLMLGLDAAGKTSILYKLKLNEMVTTIPTIGFNVETVSFRNLNMSVWDVGGQDRIRQLWRHYFHGTDCLIFVVDSNDADRLMEARDELHKVLADDALPDPLVLVYANKQDLPGAMSSSGVADGLGLRGVKQPWFIQPCSAAQGTGIVEGLEWVSAEMKKRPAVHLK